MKLVSITRKHLSDNMDLILEHGGKSFLYNFNGEVLLHPLEAVKWVVDGCAQALGEAPTPHGPNDWINKIEEII